MPRAINDSGHVAGYMAAGDSSQAIIWHQGQITRLPFDKAVGINNKGLVLGTDCFWYQGRVRSLARSPGKLPRFNALAVNDVGLIVGYEAGAADDECAVYWRNGTVYRLEPPAYFGSSAEAVNNYGQIVGIVNGDWSGGQACYWGNASLYRLGRLPDRDSGAATGINNRGTVVGYAYHAAEHVRHGELYEQAFIYESGRMRPLPSLVRHAQTRANDINPSGLIVGRSATGAMTPDTLEWEKPHAVLWESGRIWDFNDLLSPPLSGWNLRTATDINRHGQIIGCAENAGGQERYFLLTPVAPGT